jgi:uroporphyrinogen decarboxylase
MTSRERVRAIIGGTAADRTGFWLGMPQTETWELYHRHFGTGSAEELRKKLGDDLRWISPQWTASTYGKGGESLDLIYRFPKKAHGDPGPFANTESVQEVHDFRWPKAANLDFSETIAELKAAGPVYRASGFWTCFYHNVMDLFGMENYLVKMYEYPDVVHAVTDHICQYYYDANEAFFAAAGDEADAFFFGNDFGTQLDCIISPELFDEFVMPWFRKFTAQGHRWNKQVILHSCGSIYRVIDRLIEARVDCLHPLQAKATHMNAEYLAEHFKGRIAFLGGVDTQDLLVNGTPDDIRQDVRRIRKLLGPRLIVSPSHEALLPNVSAENVQAMAEAALE